MTAQSALLTPTTTTIAESPTFVIQDSFIPAAPPSKGYQTEHDLEQELLLDLSRQGYTLLPTNTSPASLRANLRTQLQALNNTTFTDNEWDRFTSEWLDNPSATLTDQSEKIHNNHILDFTFDDGHIQNIALLDKDQLPRNKLQVLHQFEQTGKYTNRYDVTILVNGLPLVHIELKKRGVSIREAFNQIHRYSKESFNSACSLFKYIQVFVISNGTDTRYFANTTQRNKNSFDFTMHWAKTDNSPIKDLKDFTSTFFQPLHILNLIINYSVFDTTKTLLLMRPYQIAATERLLWKINSSYLSKAWSSSNSGGYVWHTTGSGKTLTSFKAAQLATKLPFIDKVLFVVDRKDLDFQTLKEYQRFSPDSVNGSNNTADLKATLEDNDNKIIVTTIQKLNNLMRSEPNLPIYSKQVVFIFDECHRSQFGEAQKNLRSKFKKYYPFGFTGTPIFAQNAPAPNTTTASVFGTELHSYLITDAIRDEKVLKFKVDYHNVLPQFQSDELTPLNPTENRQSLLHPNRIRKISQYILDHFAQKTHRLYPNHKGFNAMFAVSSIEAAKLYYDQLRTLGSALPEGTVDPLQGTLQKTASKPLKIATIFSFAPNQDQDGIGSIPDENFDDTELNPSDKEFLSRAVSDYNSTFKTNFTIDSKGFQNYYRDLSARVKNQEVDLLIVVGMFLTGFDAPTLNTLFVDKNLQHHGLLQAFSRTNRILDSTKSFGNIVCFRNLEQATIDAITLFGDKNTANILLSRSFDEYLHGFTNPSTQEHHLGFLDILQLLQSKFPDPSAVSSASDASKKEFVRLFGKFLRMERDLQNFDEFKICTALHHLNRSDPLAVQAFKARHNLLDSDFCRLTPIPLPEHRTLQDYLSSYTDIHERLAIQRTNNDIDNTSLDWNDISFEIELLKSQEINLDFILARIFEHHSNGLSPTQLLEEIRRTLRASLQHRSKEALIIDFVSSSDLSSFSNPQTLLERFFQFAQLKQRDAAQEIITRHNLHREPALRYLASSLKKGEASDVGTDLQSILPKMSTLNPKYLKTKDAVLSDIRSFVAKFHGIGGSLD